MRKIFVMFALAAVFIIQMTPASAKEVFVGTRYGLDFYVDTTLIEYTSGNTFYVIINEYLGDELYDSGEWKFYNEHFDGSGIWYFDYYYIGTRIPVSREQTAEKILKTCRIYESRISI